MWTYRIKYAKLGRTRFISHLDVMRAIARAVNRAGVPIAYSRGFNPRPKISMGPALPLGYESTCEQADISLSRMLSPQTLHERLTANMPRGLDLLKTGWVLGTSPRLSDAFSASYMIALPQDETTENAETLVEDFLKRDSVPVERVRRDKNSIVDARQCVTAVSVKEEAGALWLQSDLSIGGRGSCNASEAAQAVLSLSRDSAKCLRVIRTDIRFKKTLEGEDK